MYKELSIGRVLEMCESQPDQFQDVDYAHHVTSQENKLSIMQSSLLNASVCEDKTNIGLGPRGSVVGCSGVFFCATLWNGDLPTISPYGTERIRLPLVQLFYSPDPDTGEQPYPRIFLDSGLIYKGKAYIYLVLVKGGGDSEAYLENHPHELDITDNPILHWDEDIKRFKLFNANKVWVELLVLGDVPLQYWDQVN